MTPICVQFTDVRLPGRRFTTGRRRPSSSPPGRRLRCNSGPAISADTGNARNTDGNAGVRSGKDARPAGQSPSLVRRTLFDGRQISTQNFTNVASRREERTTQSGHISPASTWLPQGLVHKQNLEPVMNLGKSVHKCLKTSDPNFSAGLSANKGTVVSTSESIIVISIHHRL